MSNSINTEMINNDTPHKHPGYAQIKEAFHAGTLKDLQSLTNFVPVDQLAVDLGIPTDELKELLQRPHDIIMKDFFHLSKLIGISLEQIFELVPDLSEDENENETVYKHPGYARFREAYHAGEVKSLSDLFKYMPKEQVAIDLEMTGDQQSVNINMNQLSGDLNNLQPDELQKLAALNGIHVNKLPRQGEAEEDHKSN
ncbi:hypothetical protein [Dinghuibacter silviterrae]|uniref:Uncharacterized protein n=1 Tax=Dinghuibacter silviterrae TaxID=1539049 RepID=A0A4R8DHY0_9BACT|nr:hypothetical protein [Dinghuibacter silviterrae]TDW97078.1 hypothetical protein EDB95_4918 [Dinghuibacter silviterrae]